MLYPNWPVDCLWVQTFDMDLEERQINTDRPRTEHCRVLVQIVVKCVCASLSVCLFGFSVFHNTARMMAKQTVPKRESPEWLNLLVRQQSKPDLVVDRIKWQIALFDSVNTIKARHCRTRYSPLDECSANKVNANCGLISRPSVLLSLTPSRLWPN